MPHGRANTVDAGWAAANVAAAPPTTLRGGHMNRRVLFTLTFWADAAERALWTAVQVPTVAFGMDTFGPFNALELDWGDVAGYAIGGFVVSVLKSIIVAPIGGGTASALPVAVAPVPPPDPPAFPPPVGG